MELLVCGVMVVAVSVPVWAQEAVTQPPDAAAIKARIDALEKEQDAAKDKLRDIRKKIERSEAVADLRRAEAEADAVYQKSKVTDEAVVAARKAERDASEALRALVLEKMKTSIEGAALLKEISDLEDKFVVFSLQEAIAKLKLTHKDSPVSRALAADPVLAELRRAYYDADEEARAEARKVYYDARKATMDKMPTVQALTAEINAAKRGEAEAEKALDAAEDKFDDMRRALEKSDDAEIAAARAKRDAARKAYEKAYYGGAVQALREARDKARQALSAKAKELLAQDTAATALSARIEELEKQIDALEDKERELRKKSE